MITGLAVATQVPRWQRLLAEAVTDPLELLRMLELDAGLLPGAREAARRFRLRVPRGYVTRMRRADPHDPLLRQVLPLGAECDTAEGFVTDPVGDLQAMQGQGLLHKYRGRVLLIATGACAIHCRYCFRRHFPYGTANAAEDGWAAALDYLHTHREIEEVILSGGDPLVLGDRRLSALVEALDGIAHLRRLRIHTRLPVVLPERVDAGLLAWLGSTRLQCIIVIHANHAQELDAAVAGALASLRATGATLLNQSVLLRGVNDDVPTLQRLSERLFELGVLPYYLHLLDRVQGAAHFEVPEAAARRLWGALAERLPGYLLPRLVREDPGAPHKTTLAGG